VIVAARAVGSSPVPFEAPRRTTLQDLLAAALVGGVLMLLACVLTTPANVPFPGHGEYFAAQAADPFSLVGRFPQRILWPVLAFFAGAVGIGPAAFSQVCSGALLATVFWFCRRHGARSLDATLITAGVAATGAVQLYQVMTCHSDTLNWILLLLLVHHAGRPAVFWPLVFVSALSHEMVFSMAPWLVWLRRHAGGHVVREVACLVATGAAYAGWSTFVRTFGAGQSFDIAYYVQENWLVLGTLALWVLFALLLVCEFGPLLAIVAWGFRQDLALGGRAGTWIYAACVLGMMAFAYDVQRFACHAFLPLVLASLRWLTTGRSRALYATLLALGMGTYVAFHWIPWQAGGWPYERAWHYVLTLEAHAPGTRQRFFTVVLPHLWIATLLFTAFAAAIVGFGLWLRRDQDLEPRTMRNASP